MVDSAKGQRDLQTGSNNYNATEFQIRQALTDLSTTKLVKVLAVTPSETVLEPGTVDVQALVDQMDGNGQPQPHGTIYEVPYYRIQGGVNAVILDPVVGDIGFCNFADRDISRVKTEKKNALPGSKRIMHMSDALYVGGILNAAPTRYIKFADDGTGIEIIGVEQVKLTGTNINILAENDINLTAEKNVNVNATTKATVTAPEVEVTAETKAFVFSPLIELGEGPSDNMVTSSSLDALGLSHPGTAKIKGTP